MATSTVAFLPLSSWHFILWQTDSFALVYLWCLIYSHHGLDVIPLTTDVTIGLVQTSYAVLEAALPMSVNVCAILIGLTEREVVVNLTTADGTAQGRPWNYCINSYTGYKCSCD